MRRAILFGAAILAALALAACGSSASHSTKSAAASSGAASSLRTPAGRAKLVACLKQHGVTLPARPPGVGSALPQGGTRTTRPPGAGLFGAGGGAGRRLGGPGARFGARFRANPKFAAAFQACGGGAFRRFGGAGALRARRTAAIRSFTACVRSHGFALPAPNLSGNGGPVFPASLQKNKRFLAAARPCESELRFGPPPGGPGG